MEQANLKIPLTLIQDYRLSPLACLLYGELSGLYFKNHRCDITDRTLSSRLNRSIPRIQSGLRELKDSGLITSKQKPNYKGRNITVAKTAENPFILIPVAIVRRKDLKENELLIYGSIYSEIQKQIKINRDKKIDDMSPDVIITRSELAKKLNIALRSVSRLLYKLANKQYIIFNSISGIGIQVNIIPINSFTEKDGHRPFIQNGGGQKLEPPRTKVRSQPLTKTTSHPGQKRATNKYIINNINKGRISKNKDFLRSHTALDEFLEDPFYTPADLQSLSSPMYYNSLPDENNIPPEQEKESYSDYEELNKLDSNQATSKHHKHKNNSRTAKSGSREKGSTNLTNTSPKHHQHKNDAETAKSGSKEKGSKELTQTTPKQKDLEPDIGTRSITSTNNFSKNDYTPYNGFNLDYQSNTLQSILRNITGKQYIITQRTKEALYQQLEHGYTLNDFETAISSLIRQGKQVSMLDLILHIGSYLDQ